MSVAKALSLTGIAITISVLASLSLTIVIINNYTTNITSVINNIVQRINQLENQTIPVPPSPPIPCGTNNYNGTCPPPPPTPNKEPVINVTSPITCTINQNCVLSAKIDDQDGNITQAIWNQESGKQVDFTSSVDHTTTPDTYTATFKPIINDTYVFSIEAQDNNGSTTLKSITAKVPSLTPNPPPPPVPTNQTLKVDMVGDLEGVAVFNQIKQDNPNLVVALGDLGYDSNLAWFKSTYGNTFNNKLLCVEGNHEAANEDGTQQIQDETQAYCGNDYYVKKGSVLFIGINTNGNLNVQLGAAQQLVTNSSFMNGIKSVHVLTHKPCASPPNAHHPVETDVKTFCDSLKAKVPASVKLFFDSGHNHVMSASADGQYKQVGSGGKSHYTCGTSTAFPFCDNTHYGFLQYNVDSNGNTTWKFIDTNGGVVK